MDTVAKEHPHMLKRKEAGKASTALSRLGFLREGARPSNSSGRKP